MRIADGTKNLQPELLRFAFFIAPTAPAFSEITQFFFTVSHSHTFPHFRLYLDQRSPASPSHLTFNYRAHASSLNLPTHFCLPSACPLLTISLRHKVVAHTHHPRRVSKILTRVWHQTRSVEQKESTCLDARHASRHVPTYCRIIRFSYGDGERIEPPPHGMPQILFRVQSAVLFLSPQHCADSPLDRLS